jgi:PPOX class probable F420-dependent enzyme
MPMGSQQWAIKLLYESRVGHMATSARDGTPQSIPICYAFNGKRIYSSIDEKPKRVGPQRLSRVRNIIENPRVSVVVDFYSDDWTRLQYVIVQGRAKVIQEGREYKRAIALLKRKYPQYRKMYIENRPVIRICPVRITGWRSDFEA